MEIQSVGIRGAGRACGQGVTCTLTVRKSPAQPYFLHSSVCRPIIPKSLIELSSRKCILNKHQMAVVILCRFLGARERGKRSVVRPGIRLINCLIMSYRNWPLEIDGAFEQALLIDSP